VNQRRFTTRTLHIKPRDMTNRLTLLICLLLSSLTKVCAQQGSSADYAIKLCDLSDLKIPNVFLTTPLYPDQETTCFQPGEQPGVWVEFQVAVSGQLVFSLVPHYPLDDLDFVIYKRGKSGLEPIVCNAQGLSYSRATTLEQLNCGGSTGLSLSSPEANSAKNAGCKTENNYLPAVFCEKGLYLLFIQNYASVGGLDVSFNESDLRLIKTFGGCKVPFVEKLNCSVAPNPAQQFLSVSIDVSSNEPLDISILDARGVVITQTHGIGVTNRLEVPIQNLLPGSYYVRVQNGAEFQVLPFVKL
jgi:Secretion system C-terminal sorting domain